MVAQGVCGVDVERGAELFGQLIQILVFAVKGSLMVMKAMHEGGMPFPVAWGKGKAGRLKISF